MRTPAFDASGPPPDSVTADDFRGLVRDYVQATAALRDQTYFVHWLGVHIRKRPNDIVALQEIVEETRPDLVIETGVFRGGSAPLFASILEILGIDRRVIAVDVDLGRVDERVREHARIELIEGSSTDERVLSRLRSVATDRRVMVDLDSDHSARHVLDELRALGPLVSPGCYLVVEDGVSGVPPARRIGRGPATPSSSG